MPEQTHLDGGNALVPGRPDMPRSYGIEPAAASGMLPWSRVCERMDGARNYWIGTTRPDGRPHVMPVWGIWLDEAFYFSTDRHSCKARNLTARPELVVHLESGDDVVILEGVAEEVTDAALLARFADAYDAKYSFRPDTSAAGGVVYALHPRVAYSWLENDFVGSATRWQHADG